MRPTCARLTLRCKAKCLEVEYLMSIAIRIIGPSLADLRDSGSVDEKDDFRAACPETKVWSSNPSLRYNRHTMPFGRIGRGIAVAAAFCVLIIFLFPSMQGPYSVVHGPVTALQAARSAARLHTAIIHSALISPEILLVSPVSSLSWILNSESESLPAILPQCNTILRC
jgi:hypothetical protein